MLRTPTRERCPGEPGETGLQALGHNSRSQPSHKQSTGNPDVSPAIRALSRLVLQKETTLRVLRLDTHWVLFLQPGETGMLSPFFERSPGQENQPQSGRSHTATKRSVPNLPVPAFAAKFSEVEDQLPKEAQHKKWLVDAGLQYQKVVPSTGSPDARCRPGPNAETASRYYFESTIPLPSKSHTIHRFHTNKQLAASINSLTACQLKTSNN